MSEPYTALGTEAGEERVRKDLSVITAAVREHVPDDRLECVALTGGFGRGEGGVVEAPGGRVSAFNDYDLVVVTRTTIDASPLLAAAPDLAAEIGVDFVDFGVFPASLLPRVPSTVFWYELREGHRTLFGKPETLLALPRIDPAELPLVEATRLLLNRGFSLLWAWLHLEESSRGNPDAMDDRRRRFTVNSIHKAILAAGDAALIRAGRYHLSYRERAARMLDVDLPFEGTDRAGFLDAHSRATRFKLQPDPDAEITGGLVPWWSRVRAWHEKAFRWIEEIRLGAPIGDWSHYPGRLAAESLQEGLRHPGRYFRERGRTRLVKGWSRHFLVSEQAHRAQLPFLLYSAGPAGLDGSLLRSGLNGFSDEPEQVRTRWRKASLDLLAQWHP